MNNDILTAILDSMPDPIVFVDTNHIIQFVNKAGVDHYKKMGFTDLVGHSIFDYHKQESGQKIDDVFSEMLNGKDEEFLKVNKANLKVFMRAVKNANGEVIGYYERFEKA